MSRQKNIERLREALTPAWDRPRPPVGHPDRRDWFVTASGRRLYILDPDPEELSIEDIAQGLSRICRFGGHTREHYSVAQHSLLVSHVVPPCYALEGLLHDASEAYLGDIIRPLKMLLPGYRQIEKRWEDVIASRFGLLFASQHVGGDAKLVVKEADLVALATERRDLMHANEFLDGVAAWESRAALPEKIQPMPEEDARECFLDRYRELVGHP